MRKPFIAGNWKMNKTLPEAVELAQQLVDGLRDCTGVDVVVAPTAVAIERVAAAVKGSVVSVSAQNCHPEASGAFTGELSVDMLKAAGCDYAIVGHSERREIFGETDAFINEKNKALLAGGLTPIFCIGETLEEREGGEMFNVLRRQVEGGMAGLSTADAATVVIAYEPVWAIGTGKTATSDQADEAHAFVRGLVAEMFDQTTADAVRILYGGSVKPTSIDELMSKEHVDGALVGGASLKAEDFVRIAKFEKV